MITKEREDERTKFILEKVVGKLKQLGAKEQLLMFVTGPAGAGKSTAIDVAQQFCFEFCKSMDIIWGDKHFSSLQSLDVQLPYLEALLCTMQLT